MIRVAALLLASLWACAEEKSDPWSWWDAGHQPELSIRATFDFEKKSRTRRKPIKLEGEFALSRKGTDSTLLLKFSKPTERGSVPESTVLIDAHRWWTLTPANEGSPATLEKVDLTRHKGLRGAVHALAFLHGKKRQELEADFTTEVVSPPDGQGRWSFRMIPRNPDDRLHVLAVTVTLERERMTSMRMELPREEWARFDFRSIGPADLKGSDLELNIPEGTQIVEDEAVGDAE